jgi:hypothetical protein
MRVRMSTTAAGPEGTWLAGTVVNLPNETAMSLVTSGYAHAVDVLPVVEPPAPEMASVEPGGENAALPKARRKRGA